MGVQRKKSERIAANWGKMINQASAVELTEEQKKALAVLREMQGSVADAADRGEVSMSGSHPVVARLEKELKALNSEVRKSDTQIRALNRAQQSVEAYERNSEYRRQMVPWLTSQIEALSVAHENGEELVEGDRPNVKRFDVPARLEALKQEWKAENDARKAAREAANNEAEATQNENDD